MCSQGWLTTIVARVCLDRLRSGQLRREQPDGVRPAEAMVELAEDLDPEQQALRADAVGSAMLVVLDRLGPAERVAFVLHDIFAVPFNDIGPIVNRSPDTARQLASRASRRLQGAPPSRSLELTHQREVIDAFLAASREGNFGGLIALLDPDVLFRADETALHLGAPMEVDGAEAVARATSGRAWGVEPGLVDWAVGLVWAPGGQPKVAFFFPITEGRIAAINMIADPEHIAELDLQPVDPGRPA
jgi:RNA polymerase sigma-70 factor, ECF subfamily